MPIALQTSTSSTQLSHQHSLKLGSQCWKVSSHSSKAMEMHQLQAGEAVEAGRTGRQATGRSKAL
jgi:hypothetical protein